MSTPKRLGVVLALLVLLGAGDSAGEPISPCTPQVPCHLRMRDDSTLQKFDGTQYNLPPGRFLDEPTWRLLDDETKRLQNERTRLEAENKSLKDSLSGWRPGWITVTSFLFLGVAAGVGGYYWYENR